MKCQELLHALNDYLDGESQSALCQLLQQHLADCNPCRVVIDNLRQTIALYRTTEAIALPAGVHEKIRSVMQERWSSTIVAARRSQDSICYRK
jgi:predicted anti-sigma-YlaC factor YlaD